MPAVAVADLVAQHDIVAPAEPFEIVFGHHPDRTGARSIIIATSAGERWPAAGFDAETAFPLDVLFDHVLDG